MFYFVTVPFILGIGLGSTVVHDAFYFYLVVLAAVVFFVFYGDRRYIIYFTVAVIFLFVGWLRFTLTVVDLDHVGEEHIGYYNGKEQEFSGVIVDEPDLRPTSVKYVVQPDQLRGKVLVTTDLYPQFEFGDSVVLRCNLKRPEPFEGFAYDAYLAKSGIYSLCYYPDMSRSTITDRPGSSAPGFWFGVKKHILGFKHGFISQINKILPAPHSGLLAGLLVGETQGIPDNLKQKFIDTGTIHIVAISGYNITIIIMLLFFIAPYVYVSLRFAWAIILPTLVGFVILTGADSSIVRAVIMALIAALASCTGRISDVRRLLILTAVVMLVINPSVLMFDVGFQLSFAATLGLIYITPRLDQYLAHVSSILMLQERFGLPKMLMIGAVTSTPIKILREIATTTMGANLAVAPLLLWHFGRVSLISPVVNILILWIIPVIMAFGFVSVVVSYFIFPIGQFGGWFTWILLEYVIEVVKWF